MKKIASILGILFATMFILGCTAMFQSEKYEDFDAPFSFVDFETDKVTSAIGSGAFKDASNKQVLVHSFSMADKETTYLQWYVVYQWALKHKYSIADKGVEGFTIPEGADASTSVPENNQIGAALLSQEGDMPVTWVSWRSALVWCNAASEKDGLEPVYYIEGTTDFTDKSKVLRIAEDYENIPDGRGKAENCVINENANGYRLPTSAELEFAARAGKTSATEEWSKKYPGNNTSADSVAWYSANSSLKTHAVGTKAANSKGLYDLSGNVQEWFFDPSSAEEAGYLGGSYRSAATACETGAAPVYSKPEKSTEVGFRVCKTLPDATYDKYYTITVTNTDGGTIISAASSKPEKTVTLTYNLDAGYSFGSFVVTDASGNPITVTDGTFVMPFANVNVTATYTANEYLITLETCEHGSISASAETANVGDEVTLTFTPEAGYGVSACTVTTESGVNVPVTNWHFTMPAENVTVSAVFEEGNYTVTVSTGIENGTVTTSKSSAKMGDVITITTGAADGYRLSSVTVTTASEGSVTVTDGKFTMPAENVTVTAAFEVIPSYNVTVTTGIENGTVTADKTSAKEGELVTLTLTPAEGYKLSSVTVTKASGGRVTVTDGKFTMPSEAVTVFAVFDSLLIVMKDCSVINGLINGWASTATHFAKSNTAPIGTPAGYLDAAEEKVPYWYDEASTTIYYYIEPGYSMDLRETTDDVNAMFRNMSKLETIETSDFYTGNLTNMEIMFLGCASLTSLDVSHFITSNVTTMAKMFSGCSGLTSLDVTNFDTKKVTYMNSMFSGCSGLTSLDVTNFDTKKVTHMNSMFSGCSGLTSIDVTNFDTKNVYDMGSMFFGCSGLESLDLSSFDTSMLHIISFMFSGCSKLKSLDLSNFDTNSVTVMSSMFQDCSALTTIYASEDFVTTSVSYSENMFKDCTNLTGGAGTKYSSSYKDKTYARIDKAGTPGYFTKHSIVMKTCSEINGLIDDWALTATRFAKANSEPTVTPAGYLAAEVEKVPYWYDGTSATIYYYIEPGYCMELRTSDGSNAMFRGMSKLESIETSDFDTSKVTNMGYMFYNCTSLTSLDVSKFDTGNVTTMGSMFRNCSSLESLDVSKLDTSKVTSMSCMFDGCSSLKSLDLSKFDTGNVTTMEWMFDSCSSLTSLDVSKFDTRKVTTMSKMFYHCTSLESLDVSKFNTISVTAMSSMFSGCSGLESLDVSKFNTGNVTDMRLMFSGCSGLESLDASKFDTSKVTTMEQMFRGCSFLTSLDVSSFDTSNVTNMIEMFRECSSLTSLDVSSFDTSNVTTMQDMFSICLSLNTIYASENFVTTGLTGSFNMFYLCSNLVGGAGTAYELDESPIDETYARIDKAGTPGYFTEKTKTPIVMKNCSDINVMISAYKDVATRFAKSNSAPSPSVTPAGYLAAEGEKVPYWYDSSDSTIYYYIEPGYSMSLRVSGDNNLFACMSKLESIETSDFDTSNVTDMGSMFYGCSSLASLDVSKFETSSVVTMANMFYGCSSLTSLDVSKFETSSVGYMNQMFRGCSGLESLDVSNFNTSSVRNMDLMFYNCSALTTIYASENFVTTSVTNNTNMFSGCSSLVGGAGTTYSSSYIYVTYAHIDGGVGNPGYFTEKTN